MMPMNSFAQRAFPVQPPAPPQNFQPQTLQPPQNMMQRPTIQPPQPMLPNPDAGNFGMRQPQMGLRPPMQAQSGALMGGQQQIAPQPMPPQPMQLPPQQPVNNLFAQRMARY